MRPLILIDVDGVLNPSFSAKTRKRLQYHEGWIRPRGYYHGDEYRLFLNPLHGKWLRELSRETDAELAWGTTWEECANSQVGRWLKLPPLPWAPAPKHRKPDGVVPWTGGRPFAWFDDDTSIEGKVKQRTSQPHKVIWVDEHTGLTQEHIRYAREWLLSLHEEAPDGN
jgi:hypothetical protein